MFITLFFIPLFKKIKQKKLTTNSHRNLAELATFKGMDDKTIRGVDGEKTVRKASGRPTDVPHTRKVTGTCG